VPVTGASNVIVQRVPGADHSRLVREPIARDMRRVWAQFGPVLRGEHHAAMKGERDADRETGAR